ncbi:MAG: hypothetical protein ACI4WM_07915 [Erysipelotrichaceae bacterium]
MQRIINKGVLSNDYEVTVYLKDYQKALLLNVLKVAKAFYEGSSEKLIEFVKNGFNKDMDYVKGYENNIKELNETIICNEVDSSLISLLNEAIFIIEEGSQTRHRISKEVFETICLTVEKVMRFWLGDWGKMIPSFNLDIPYHRDKILNIYREYGIPLYGNLGIYNHMAKDDIRVLYLLFKDYMYETYADGAYDEICQIDGIERIKIVFPYKEIIIFSSLEEIKQYMLEVNTERRSSFLSDNHKKIVEDKGYYFPLFSNTYRKVVPGDRVYRKINGYFVVESDEDF